MIPFQASGKRFFITLGMIFSNDTVTFKTSAPFRCGVSCNFFFQFSVIHNLTI